MKKYQVELEYVGYIMYSIEAEDEEEAEDKAWKMLNSDAEYTGRSGDWNVHSVTEAKDKE